MTWFTQTANATEAAKSHVDMFLAVDLDFPSAHVRVWSGWGDMTINGSTFTGIGQLGAVGVVPDGAKMVAEQKSFRLSGVDPSLVSEADIDACFGRSVIEYFGFLSNGALLTTPEINWEGRMGAVNRVDSAEPYIEVLAKSRMALLDIPNGWRYTHEHQQQFFPGDNGLNLVPSVMTAQVVWGGQKVSAGIINAKVAALQAKQK